MLKGYTFTKNQNKTLLFSGICFILSLLLIFMSRYLDHFAQWYAVTIYPIFLNTIGRFFSIWDFSFFETGLFVILFLIISLLLLLGFTLIMRRTSIKAYINSVFRFLICLTFASLLLYTSTCAINYQREGIGAILNLPVEEPTKERLEKLCGILVDDLSRLKNDQDWSNAKLTLKDYAYIETEAVNNMKLLGRIDPALSGYYPNPKPVYFSKALSKFGIEGFYSPFTIEANYNKKVIPFLIPYTITHELAHSKGYMREDDAGFIAFMACKNSSSKLFQYSASFHALNFTLDELRSEVSEEEFWEISQGLPLHIKIQLGYLKGKNDKQTNSLLILSKSINNLYLLANAQPQGTDSYNRMADLLLAEYADRIDSEGMI